MAIFNIKTLFQKSNSCSPEKEKIYSPEETFVLPTFEDVENSIIREIMWINHITNLTTEQNPDMDHLSDQIRQQRFMFNSQHRMKPTLEGFLSDPAYRREFVSTLIEINHLQTDCHGNAHDPDPEINRLIQTTKSHTIGNDLFELSVQPIYNVIKNDSWGNNKEPEKLIAGIESSRARFYTIFDTIMVMQNRDYFTEGTELSPSLIARERQCIFSTFEANFDRATTFDDFSVD